MTGRTCLDPAGRQAPPRPRQVPSVSASAWRPGIDASRGGVSGSSPGASALYDSQVRRPRGHLAGAGEGRGPDSSKNRSGPPLPVPLPATPSSLPQPLPAESALEPPSRPHIFDVPRRLPGLRPARCWVPSVPPLG